MFANYKALLVLLIIVAGVFRIFRAQFANFISDKDYSLRRNTWLALLIAAFLIQNYWIYAMISIGVIAYALKKDSNPAALYLFLLLAIPPFGDEIPSLGPIKQLFQLNHLRLLSIVILIPTAIAMRRRQNESSATRTGIEFHGNAAIVTDVLLIIYCAVQFLVWLPYESATNSLRRGLLFYIDVFLPYFIMSRACKTQQEITEVMASFVLSAIALSCMGVLESLKGWLLFAGVEEVWGTSPLTGFLRRGDALRAQVTSGQSIVLGYALAMALGFWLYLQTKVSNQKNRWLITIILVAGLGATYARGPWLGALIISLTYFSLGPRALSRLLKALILFAIASVALMLSPWGADFIDRLPFIGTADQEGSVVYRQRLAAQSWLLIQQNLLFGSRSVFESMEDLRQGEGIIDIVNTYAYVALVYGLAGLLPFVGFFGVASAHALGAVRKFKVSDPGFSLLGSSFVAAIVGTLLIIATVGLYLSIGYLVWIIAGLAVSYTRLSHSSFREK